MEEPDHLDNLPRELAAKRLNTIRLHRAVQRAHEGGESQVSIAKRMGVTQGRVGQMLRAVELQTVQTRETPMEIILRRAVGEISSEVMMEHLLHWPYQSQQLDHDDEFGWSEYAEPGQALREGLLSREEYDLISARIHRSPGGVGEDCRRSGLGS